MNGLATDWNCLITAWSYLVLPFEVVASMISSLFFPRVKVGENPVDENPVAETTNGTHSEDKHEKTE